MNATVASAYMIGAITFVVSIILAIAIATESDMRPELILKMKEREESGSGF